MGRILSSLTPKAARGIAVPSRRRRRKPLAAAPPKDPPKAVNRAAAVSNNNNNNNTSIVPTHATRQALALDTRLLLVPDRDGTTDQAARVQTATTLYQTLLQDLFSTGLIPCALARTRAVNEPDQSTRMVLDTQVLGSATDLRALTQMIQPIVLSAPKTTDEASLPKEWRAKNTWKLVSELVNSLTITLDKTKSTDIQSLDVTLVLRASSLVGNHDAHVQGLGAAVEQLRGHFEQSKIQSLSLVFFHHPIYDNVHAVQTLQQQLQDKLQELSFTAPAKVTGLPLNVSIRLFHDSAPGYKKLVQQLVYQSLGKTCASEKLLIDLPGTADGFQCQLQLKAEYNLLVTSLGNAAYWKLLAHDLQALCSGGPLQVQQLIPYSALDASLLFGVPIKLSASTQWDDVQEYQTMQVLFASLLRLLQDRELVLLLQVASASDIPQRTVMAQPGQTLVLMVRETTGTSTPPQTALLWGYATACQWLANDDSLPPNPRNTLQDNLASSEYGGYVDASMEQVECGPYNPLVPRVADSSSLWNALASHQTGHDTMDTKNCR